MKKYDTKRGLLKDKTRRLDITNNNSNESLQGHMHIKHII